MKIKTLIALLALLLLPQAAHADTCVKSAGMGIQNCVGVASPSKLYAGDTQTHRFTITASTTPAKVTVEWVKVINSMSGVLGSPGNYTLVKPMQTFTGSFSGNTTWTVPDGTPAGHYAVITRYYARGYVNPEDEAASSFIVGRDLCTNITGAQATIPAGLVVIAGDQCVKDVCDNLTGVQTETPAGLTNTAGVCAKDVCDNITGVQTETPAGLTNTNGVCVKDVCDNLTGVQTETPTGLTNTAGVCVKDVCDNITGVQTETPAGLTNTNGVCTQTADPTGDPAILKITKVASKQVIKAGGAVKFTIRIRNTGKGDAPRTRVCDYMPNGLVYVSHSGSATFSRGRLCWTINGVKAGKHVTVGTVTGRVVKGYMKKSITNRACIMRSTHPNATTRVCANAKVRVKRDHTSQPSGGVTG
jgi:uncharacterized repeat protein (TIGR01451 family)